MLKAVIIRDFFSFRGEVRILLNDGINILLGINGSGKTSFINALRLLSEGIAGNGVENLIQKQWGGFSQILNCSGRDKPENIQIIYVFDYHSVNNCNSSCVFHSDVYYQITIHPLGTTDYYLDEKLWTEHNLEEGKNFVYLDFHNGQGRLSKRLRDEGVFFQSYTNGDISGRELVLKQISDPVQYLPVY